MVCASSRMVGTEGVRRSPLPWWWILANWRSGRESSQTGDANRMEWISSRFGGTARGRLCPMSSPDAVRQSQSRPDSIFLCGSHLRQVPAVIKYGGRTQGFVSGLTRRWAKKFPHLVLAVMFTQVRRFQFCFCSCSSLCIVLPAPDAVLFRADLAVALAWYGGIGAVLAFTLTRLYAIQAAYARESTIRWYRVAGSSRTSGRRVDSENEVDPGQSHFNVRGL